MVEIKAKLKVRQGAYRVSVSDRLELTFDSRQKSRLRTRLASGEEVALMLPRGEILRGGDLVTAADGRVIEIVSSMEKILHIEAGAPQDLAKAAYHLGNRHVPVQVGETFLRIAEDHVLEEMLVKLGAKVSHVEAPFEPEAGAYAGGHQHRHDEMGHGGKIHEFGEPKHDHGHDHGDDHDHHHHDGCGHDHKH